MAGGTNEPAATRDTTAQTQSESANLPYTSPPTVVDVDQQGGEVTMRTQRARHAVQSFETIEVSVEFPRVWAFQADDNDLSVASPILRTTEETAMKVTLDDTTGQRPHTIHFHGVRKTGKYDDVPTTTGIKVPPGEKHPCEIPANVPGTHFYHCHFQTHRHIDMGCTGFAGAIPKATSRPTANIS